MQSKIDFGLQKNQETKKTSTTRACYSPPSVVTVVPIVWDSFLGAEWNMRNWEIFSSNSNLVYEEKDFTPLDCLYKSTKTQILVK